jgi:hypothetical protein
MTSRQDLSIYNESTGMVLCGREKKNRTPKKSRGDNWSRLVAQDSLLALELYQDDSFVVRVVVGDELTAAERAEAVDRVTGKLFLPTDGLAVCGGRDFVDDPDDEDNDAVVIHPVPAGTYTIELLVYPTGVGAPPPENWSPGHGRWVDFLLRLTDWSDRCECTPRTETGWIARRSVRPTGRPFRGLPADLPATDRGDDHIPPPGRKQIRILATPPGDAPDWVRQAWIGLTLPLAPDAPAGQDLVYSHEAVAVLAKANPKAADWWRKNFPRACGANGITFAFAQNVYEKVT